MIALTLDVDWAPDFAIDLAAQTLREHQVRATWFVTHRSPAVERLAAEQDLFELGIHPNFLPGSSHGSTPEAVLDACMAMVPEARSMRTHGLVQSTGIFDLVMARTPIRADVSLLLPRARHLTPHAWRRGGRSLTRLPYFWADDVEMESARPSWDVAPLLEAPGLKIFAFHPIHVALNSADFGPYERLKCEVESLRGATARHVEARAHHGPGTRSAFTEVVAHLRGAGRKIADLHDGPGTP
ncbi:MAG: hypothetical protein IT373_37110 [Polyangiaceae bacterium]|nr:hypothetical protein [Polyangiaceae bacterium]